MNKRNRRQMLSLESVIALCDYVEKDIEETEEKLLETPETGIPVCFGDGIVEVLRADEEGVGKIKAELKTRGVDCDQLVMQIRHKFQPKRLSDEAPQQARGGVLPWKR